MGTPRIITDTPTSRAQARAALAVTAALLLAAGLVLPVGNTPLPANPGFLPAFGGMMFLGDLITACLLFSQARASGDRSTADLGSAYLFAAMIIVPHLMAFPGVFAEQPLIGQSASAVWLWCAWHTGFALLVLRYAWRRGRVGAARVRLLPTVFCLAAIAAILAAVATAGLPFLPRVLAGHGFQRLNALGIGPAVFACNVAALALVAFRLRGRTVVDLWLTVAMLTATLDVILTLAGGGRYTLGWYGARLLSLGTDIAILVALLSELGRMFRRLSDLNAHLQTLTMTDGLTQIANRRCFDDALSRAWRTAEREETAISLLMLDLDWFKGFNDSHGHPAGDECLRRVAALISSHARRPYDIAARLGGEEFALLMPATEEAGAAMIAERVRAGIENLGIAHPGSRFGHVTVSGGIATLRPSARRDPPAALLAAADRALYAAKSDGRNAVAVQPVGQDAFAPAPTCAAPA
jgi:diguanylate cyclase (GGDEF)-like protein